MDRINVSLKKIGELIGMPLVNGHHTSELEDFSQEVRRERARRDTTVSNESDISSGSSSTDQDEEEEAGPMTSEEFRVRAKVMVDYIADYLDNLENRRVTPSVQPGYLRHRLPVDPPMDSENWDKIMNDVELHIMTGMTHWQHPRFHAYFPAGNSYPSIMADMLSDALGCVGFSWAASPACTELETIMVDWLGRMIDLPKKFLPFTEGGNGGGVLQGSASECILVSLLAARNETLRELERTENCGDRRALLHRLRAYCSTEAHSSVEKAAMIALVNIRIIPSDDEYKLNSVTLARLMEEDRAAGLVPFFVSTTIGTTGCCAVDNLAEIGPVCRAANVWLHVDAAYAGNALICPEFRYLMNGIEYASSFNLNPNKWMLVNFDCSAMWVDDRVKLTDALTVDPLYLQHDYSNRSIDYRNWSIPLSRRFRSLKLWFVIRSYGVEGLRSYIREHCRLAKLFAKTLLEDDRFEVMNEVIFGLVCFRLRGINLPNEQLLSSINESGELHMVPSMMKKVYVIRFCVCSPNACDADMIHACQIIREMATEVQNVDDIPLSDNEMQSEAEDTLEDPSTDSFYVVRKDSRRGSVMVKRTPFARLVSEPEYYRKLSIP